MSNFLAELFGALEQWLTAVRLLLPRVLAALVILGIGLAVATIVRRLVALLLRRTTFDVTSHRLGLAGLLQRGGAEGTPSSIVGSMAYWLVLTASALQGLSALGLESTDRFVGACVSLLSRTFLAVLILAAGYIVSLFFARATLIAAVNAHMRPARWIAAGVQTLIVLFSCAIALEEMGIASAVVRDAFSILFGGVVLALALAFGLGGQTVAREILEQRWRQEGHDADHTPPSELRHL